MCGAVVQTGVQGSTSAKTSRTQGASLRVTMTLPTRRLEEHCERQRVKVSLPKQLPTPLKTLQKACLEKTFAEDPANCPVASKVGTVKVSTPVLPGGSDGHRVLRLPWWREVPGTHHGPRRLEWCDGAGARGNAISKAGITTATFATVPDVPFSSFELMLPQREFPALTANGNLCKGTLLMPTELVGQNGLVITQSTKIAVTGCPKAKKATHKKAKRRGRPSTRRRRVGLRWGAGAGAGRGSWWLCSCVGLGLCWGAWLFGY